MSLTIYLTGNEIICPNCKHTHVTDEPVFDVNITHNLSNMADLAGLYYPLWQLKDVETAKDLIVPLKIGIKKMKDSPEIFKSLDASNGWGTYEDFMPWLERLLEVCENNPNSKVEVSR